MSSPRSTVSSVLIFYNICKYFDINSEGLEINKSNKWALNKTSFVRSLQFAFNSFKEGGGGSDVNDIEGLIRPSNYSIFHLHLYTKEKISNSDGNQKISVPFYLR